MPKVLSLSWVRKNKLFIFGGETSRIGELFIDVSPPFLRVEIEWGLL